MRSARPQATASDVNIGLAILKQKLEERLKEKGRGIYISSHEVLGILTEEMNELEREVEANNVDGVRDELLDVAVGAIFGLVSCNTQKMDW